jgi:hypothetical protein
MGFFAVLLGIPPPVLRLKLPAHPLYSDVIAYRARGNIYAHLTDKQYKILIE